MTTVVHVKANGNVILEECSAQKPYITLELSEEAAKALKYVCGVTSCTGKFGGYTAAIYKAIDVDTDDYKEVIEGSLEWLK